MAASAPVVPPACCREVPSLSRMPVAADRERSGMRRSLRLVGALLVIAAAGLAVPLLHPGGSPGTATPELGRAPTGSLRAAAIPAEAAAPAVVPQSREEIRYSFAPVVKRVAPAVVNVYATSRVEVRSPFEGDPFFERFFGL